MDKSDPISTLPTELVPDSDAIHLAELGYKQELKRHFSQWSLVAFGVTFTATWTALGGGLGTGIYSGGAPGIIYGFLLMWIGQSFVGACIAEFASSFPTTGGMYHWVAMLAPEKFAPVLSFMTGWNTVFAYVVSTSSINCVASQQIVALYAIVHPGFVIERWHSFLTMEILNILTLIMVLFMNKLFPLLEKAGLFLFLSSFVISTVTVLSMAPSFRSGHEVFGEFINSTGWSTDGMAFITGLVNAAFAISALDGTCHISEEVPHPEKNVPRAVFYTLCAALITGWVYLMAIFFSYQNLDAILETPWDYAIAELYHQATGSIGGAFGLTFLLTAAGLWASWNCQLSAGRIYWSFARDNAVPYSKTFSHVDTRLNIPVNAHVLCAIVSGLLGLLYMWADAAFAAFIASAVIFFNLTYIVPIGVNVILRRKTFRPGWFYMRRIGLAVHSIAFTWLLFTIAVLGLPYVRPVTPENMNYTWVIVGAGVIFELAIFYLVKKRTYNGPILRGVEEATEIVLDGQKPDMK